MPGPLKNIRHETFARNLVETTKTGGTKGNAYSKAGFKSVGAAADVCASKLLNNTKNGIAQRVQELMLNGAKRAEVSVASLLNELEEAREGATTDRQFAAVTGAIMAKAKLSGMLVDKVEVGGVGAFDQVETIEDCVRLMLADQTPAEALELLDVLRRQVEVFAATYATLVEEPARPAPGGEAELSLALFRPKHRRR